jgi:hypothetical protein
MYRWKNTARYLSRFIKDIGKPIKYNLSNDLKSITKKSNKIPGFNNFTLNNSFNNFESMRFFSKSPKTASKLNIKYIIII